MNGIVNEKILFCPIFVVVSCCYLGPSLIHKLINTVDCTVLYERVAQNTLRKSGVKETIRWVSINPVKSGHKTSVFGCCCCKRNLPTFGSQKSSSSQHTHTLSLTHCLSHTVYTHTQYNNISFALSHLNSYSITLSLSHTHTHLLTYFHKLTYTIYIHFLISSFIYSLSISHILLLNYPFFLSLSKLLTHSQTFLFKSLSHLHAYIKSYINFTYFVMKDNVRELYLSSFPVLPQSVCYFQNKKPWHAKIVSKDTNNMMIW